MKTTFASGALLTFTLFFAIPAFGQTDTVEVQSDRYGEDLGTVDFPASCEETARQQAARGLALVHHMTYEGAKAAFAAASESDPDCAMAHWGQRLSLGKVSRHGSN